MAREITPWDAAGTSRSKEDIAAHLDAVLEDGGPELLRQRLPALRAQKA
jgi:DNA-binding phage protein